MRWIALLGVALCAVQVAGCGTKGPPRKQTFPVSGKVTVDGAAPPSTVQVECHNVAGMDEKMPTFSRTETKTDGTFEVATYEQKDGVPPGDYVLVFTSREFNVMSRDYGPDKFNGRYSDPKKSDFKFTVKDKPVDLGEIKLTTK